MYPLNSCSVMRSEKLWSITSDTLSYTFRSLNSETQYIYDIEVLNANKERIQYYEEIIDFTTVPRKGYDLSAEPYVKAITTKNKYEK